MGDAAVRRRRISQDTSSAALFLAPNVLLVGAFLFLPIIASVVVSFTEWDVVSPARSVGLENYREIIGDERFLDALRTTLVFVGLSVPLTLLAALVIAVLLDSVVYGKTAFRIAVFVPFAMSSVLVALMWKWFFSGPYGLLNYLLSFIGIQGPDWLNDPTWALPSVVVVFMWQQIGFNVVLFLVALREVPIELRWAARVDGAGSFREFRSVVLPLITPIVFFALVNISINAFQMFDLAYVMTRGGPGTATTVVMQYIYQAAFGSFRMGYASAAAVIYVGVIGAFTLLLWLTRKRWVLGEGE